MTTRLDREIASLENLVENRLGLCSEVSNGLRCILPVGHSEVQPHKFPAAGLVAPVPALKLFCESDVSSEPCRLCRALAESSGAGALG